jgi:2-polyprenyl-6-methoxyphenol hydroxylase-like FAD-dependent oxidoreductase
VQHAKKADRPNVGILGGSITGCAVAAELARAGCGVTVLERGGEEPKDRGAGIGLPPSLVETLVEHDLIDADVPHLDVHTFRHLVRDERQERYGLVLWEQPGNIAHLNWGALYRNLRRRVPEGAYHTGCKVTGLRESDHGTVAVTLAEGRTREFDLLVCADGYGSLGRRTLFPDWGLYLGVYEDERAELLTGSDPAAYDGPMPAAREAKLKAWVPEVLPEYFAEIVNKSSATHVQKVHESTVPAYRKGRICLAGDAGALARPHTGTGVLKGITDAIGLADALRAHASLDDALTHWSDERTAHGNELVRLASQIGRALAAEIPGGPKADPAAKQKQFSSMVTVPSEVFVS